MDRRISVRFYRISPALAGTPDIPELLMQQQRQKVIGKRERNLGDGVVFRLERCAVHKDYHWGEFCRKQTENIPPQAGDAGLDPIILENGRGLGHVAAFVYHAPSRVLLLESNRQCGSPSRLALYLKACGSSDLFVATPVIRQDAWERLKGRHVRSFTVRFADIQSLSSVDVDGLSAAKSAQVLAEAYDGPSVEITISVGRKRGISLATERVMRTLFSLRARDIPLEKLGANTTDGEKVEWIDLIEEHLSASKVINVAGLKPLQHFKARLKFLVDTFQDNANYLESQFKVRVDGKRRR